MSSPFLDSMLSRRGSPTTWYDADATTHLGATSVLISNDRQVIEIGTARGDIVTGLAPSDFGGEPGHVLAVTQDPVNNPAAVTWYVLIKPLLRSRQQIFDRGVTMALRALPSILTGQRVIKSAVGSLNGYGDPRTQAEVTTISLAIRAGFANQANPLTQQDIGAVPRGITTIYVPIGSDVRPGDEVTLPDGTPSYVQQANLQYTDGSAWALQLLLDGSAGQGVPLLPSS